MRIDIAYNNIQIYNLPIIWIANTFLGLILVHTIGSEEKRFKLSSKKI